MPQPAPLIPWRDILTLDLRSLALLRIGLGVILAFDWLDRLPDLRAHYSDDGVWPRQMLDGVLPFSVHLFSGATWFQGALAGIAFVLAGLLIVGYRTPVVVLFNWLLLLSVHGRNVSIIQGGDMLLRLLLFWGMFLPLGACWSLDARRAKPRVKAVASVATFAFLLQLCLVYLFAAAWKWAPEWRTEGTAVHQALSVSYFSTRVGLWLRDQTTLCQMLTYSTLWLEALGPVLLWLPFSVTRQRLFAIAAFLMFHVGLGIAMELGNFPWVCCVMWLALLPTAFWDRLEKQLAWRPISAPDGAEPEPRCGPVARAILILFVVYVVLWNLRYFDYEKNRDLFPDQASQLGWVLGLDQSWGLFAPRPGRIAGWYVMAGTLADGTRVDLYNGEGPADFSRPELVSATYSNGRWRKMIINLGAATPAGRPVYPGLLPGYARYLAREWTRKHGTRNPLTAVEIVYMQEFVVPPGEAIAPATPITLFRYEPQDDS